MSFDFRRASRPAAGPALVFDLDGTLIESAADLHAAAAVLFFERGLVPLELAAVTSFIGHGIPSLVERCYCLR